jgi:hypothetical protein
MHCILELGCIPPHHFRLEGDSWGGAYQRLTSPPRLVQTELGPRAVKDLREFNLIRGLKWLDQILICR